MLTKTSARAKRLAEAIAELDLSFQDRDLAKLEKDRRAFGKKQQEAQSEAIRLANAIRDWEGPDAEQATEAIVRGAELASVVENTTSKEDLIAKKEALQAVSKELNERSKDYANVMASARNDMNMKIADAVRPFVEEIMRSSEAAAKQLLENAAVLSAIQDACHRYTSENTAHRTAKDGLSGMGKILSYQRTVPVPTDVVKALKPLEEKAPAARVAIRNEAVFL